MLRNVWWIVVVALLAGCTVELGSDTSPHRTAPPASPQACASRTARPSPRPTPEITRLAWRAEYMPDGAVRMTLGDIDAAPRAPGARRVLDHRHPGSDLWCDRVAIVKAKGWWCTTTVDPVALFGEIVVGGAAPRAQLRGAGFSTRCSGRPHRMRQHYQIQRDSWSGWRAYDRVVMTPWTVEQERANGQVSAVCPRGRVGTYDYRLLVKVDIDGIPVGDTGAASAPLRTDCGTGIS